MNVRTFLEFLDEHECRNCGRPIISLPETVDNCADLEPHLVPARGLLSGWRFDRGHWYFVTDALQRNPPDLQAFPSHRCTDYQGKVLRDMFNAPKVAGEGDRVSSKELSEKGLLLITVHELKKDVTTDYGTSDALRADVVALESGETWSDTLIFSKALVSALSEPGKYLGRIGQTKFNNGHTGWQFTDSQSDAKAVELATKYLEHAKTTATTAAAAPAAAAPWA